MLPGMPSQPSHQPLPVRQGPWNTVDLWERGPQSSLQRKCNVQTGSLADAIDSSAKLRIVIGASDIEDEWCPNSLENVYRVFNIPHVFALERVQSVSHSFGSNSVNNEFCSWFHFLCRCIPDHDGASADMMRYWRAGFFLRKSASLGVTLVMFAPLPTVVKRLECFIESTSWSTACETPYILFNLVLGALFLEVDETVWTMGTLFSKLEREITNQVDESSEYRKQQYYKPPFGTLHRYANDLAYLKETIRSNLLVTEAILERTKEVTRDFSNQLELVSTEDDYLRDGLLYHQSLFRSTQLRLSSLDKRIQNASTLAFNMVAQQDSLIMMHDSASVAILTVVASVFLPITSIATIIGSQLFVSNPDDQGNWTIVTTPLISYLYIIGVPVTFAVLFVSYLWSSRRRSKL